MKQRNRQRKRETKTKTEKLADPGREERSADTGTEPGRAPPGAGGLGRDAQPPALRAEKSKPGCPTKALKAKVAIGQRPGGTLSFTGRPEFHKNPPASSLPRAKSP